MNILNVISEKQISDLINENIILKKKLKIQTRILRYLFECGKIEVDFLLKIMLNVEKIFNEKIIGEIIDNFKDVYDNNECLNFNYLLNCIFETLVKKINENYLIKLDLEYDFNTFFNEYATSFTLVENWFQKFKDKLSRTQIIKIEKIFERIFE